MEQESVSLYEKKGYVNQAIGGIITLVVGVGVAVLVMIFVGTLGGQTYQLTESKITSITNANVSSNVILAIQSGFTALKQTGDYLPIIVLAVIIALVLSMVLGFTQFGGSGGGSAL